VQHLKAWEVHSKALLEELGHLELAVHLKAAHGEPPYLDLSARAEERLPTLWEGPELAKTRRLALMLDLGSLEQLLPSPMMLEVRGAWEAPWAVLALLEEALALAEAKEPMEQLQVLTVAAQDTLVLVFPEVQPRMPLLGPAAQEEDHP